MRLTIATGGLLVCHWLAYSPAAADLIHLRGGEKIDGRVMEYVDQQLKIELPDGKVIIRKMTEVERIEFGEQPSAGAIAIEAKLKKAIEDAKPSLASPTRPKAGIAMYIDTADPDAVTPNNRVGYKCYSGGGYSGAREVPLRHAVVQLETGRAGERRIELDPGPPYKIVNRHVTLKPGEIVNLGRIKLERQEYEGTASIKGFVRDTAGEPIPGVTVTAGDRQVVTDAKGRYQLDGFELENVSIQAETKGFRGGTTKVSIRDMRIREIKKDLILFRPRKVKLLYVISAKGNNSFKGPGVEKGTIELVVDSLRNDLSRHHYSSESFRKFAADTRLMLQFERGEMKLRNFMAPVFYQESATGAGFETVKSMGAIDMNQQNCPPIEEGDYVLIRGFKNAHERGVSPYCVKILVEEVSLQPTDVVEK